MQQSIKQEQKQKISDKALEQPQRTRPNLNDNVPYFKPEAEKTYVIKINPEDKVDMVKNPKFADKDGNVPTRFEFRIKHINNDAHQLWTISKTLCKQIVTELGKGYTVLEIKRHGSDRSTTYDVKGVQ